MPLTVVKRRGGRAEDGAWGQSWREGRRVAQSYRGVGGESGEKSRSWLSCGGRGNYRRLCWECVVALGDCASDDMGRWTDVNDRHRRGRDGFRGGRLGGDGDGVGDRR